MTKLTDYKPLARNPNKGTQRGTGAIKFDCELRQVKSMADHTFNVIFNIPEYDIEQVQKLMTMLGDMVAVALVRVSNSDDKEYGGRLK